MAEKKVEKVEEPVHDPLAQPPVLTESSKATADSLVQGRRPLPA